MNANDRQVGGTHYQTTYQHWDFTIQALHNRYLEGAVTKYVTRWPQKGGIQDLEKASHFLDKLMEAYKAGLVMPLATLPARGDVAGYLKANHMGGVERNIISILAYWHDSSDLEAAQRLLKGLIAHVVAEAPRA